MSKQAFKRMRRALRMEVSRKPLDSFAWPGGYPIYYLMADGGVLCPDCINREILIVDGERKDVENGERHPDKQWHCVGYDVNFEDVNCKCDHCYKFIDPAYITGGELAAARSVDDSEDITIDWGDDE